MAITTIYLDPYSSIPYLLQTDLETVKNILTKSVRDEYISHDTENGT